MNTKKSQSVVVIPEDAKDATPSSADVDLTALWTDQPFARGLRNNTSTAANISVKTLASNTTVTYYVPAGTSIYGYFKTVVNATTTVTNIIAEK